VAKRKWKWKQFDLGSGKEKRREETLKIRGGQGPDIGHFEYLTHNMLVL
jgi:hypothetical protein